MLIQIIQGDITKCTTDAIVNAANKNLLAGGGVCGAIHKAAGHKLELACKEIGGCETGQAVITPAFKLPCNHVIQAVGPRWYDGSRDEAELLKSTYRSVYELVIDNNIQSVAIPAISTGIYRFPLELATQIAFDITGEYEERLSGVKVVFVCFGSDTCKVYEDLYEPKTGLKNGG